MALIDELLALKTKLNNIGEAIRAKTEKTDLLTLAAMPDEIASIVTGNGSTEGKQKITVIDYDGTIIEETYVAEGEYYTLPQAPNHSRLDFHYWASPIGTNGNERVLIGDYPITIAPIYNTKSGLLEMDIKLTAKTGKTVTLQNIDQSFIEWGDGEDNAGDGLSHEYSGYGEYTIKIYGVTSIGSFVFGQKSATPNLYCVGLYIGVGISTIGANAFQYCEELKYLTIPNDVESIANYAFDSCINLQNAIIPRFANIGYQAFGNTRGGLKNVVFAAGDWDKTIGAYAFRYAYGVKQMILPEEIASMDTDIVANCFSLKIFKFPDYISGSTGAQPMGSSLYTLERIIIRVDELTYLPGSFASNCYALEHIEIPETVEKIRFNAFSNCYSLKKIKIPKNVSSIGSAAFLECCSLETIDFRNHTRVPTLDAVSALSGISEHTKIVVPDGLYGSWITATNWVNYANYIYKASEV